MPKWVTLSVPLEFRQTLYAQAAAERRLPRIVLEAALAEYIANHKENPK